MIPMLRSRHVKLLFNGLLPIAILLAGMGISFAQSGDGVITQEYFVQQDADEALLVRINAFEAEFESSISGQEGQLLLQSAITGSRVVPVFQYIDAPEKSRQLEIKVTSDLHTNRSEFGLGLTRMKAWDYRSNSVSRAYQLLSYGMQSSGDSTEANWTVKIDSLLNAGKLFQRFGMAEMRLWSNYLATHLIQFHLRDHSMVYTMTREILADLKGKQFHKIELATLQLQAAALIGLRRSGKLRTSAGNSDPAQTVLTRTAVLAESMGYRFEQARALSDSGAEYAARSLYTKALGQFQLAVEIADSVGDANLATTIRESIVQVHTLQGNAPASSEVLREIETRLVEGGSGDELALNLLAQGRLFIRSYRYNQALEVLLQALDHQNDSAIRKQANFELARVFYQTGHPDEAIRYLQLAEVSAGSSQQKRDNSVIDVGAGLQIMANIHRSRGEYEQMRVARSAQGKYRTLHGRFLYDQGLDELARAMADHRGARSFFRQSFKAAGAAGHEDLQHLSRLQFCALESSGDNTNSMCSKTAVRASYDRLTASGVPAYGAEAMFLWAQLQARNGRRSEAATVMGALVDEIHFLRYSLPGVLGAWYGERHERLFERYLELLINGSTQRGRANASASLLALSKIRSIEKYSDLDPVSSGDSQNTHSDTNPNTDLLRTQLAQRANSSPGQALPALNEQINRGLAEIRTSFREKFEFLSLHGLRKYLRSLANDETVLTYHISPTSARVWVGKKAGVQQLDIANHAYLYGALQAARQELGDKGISAFDSKMAMLGKILIAPVADLLTETIYWIPAGPLLGFPLDALRVEGRYLLERHDVVNLVSFPASADPGASLQTGKLQNVFLAGHPQDYSGEYATRLDTSTEIRAIADIFVGPGLRIVQGAALLADEFQDGYFRQAGLVHLSMPGVIDLNYPGRSSLELSGNESSPGRTSFTAMDIRSQKLEARLVFLSATRMRGDPVTGFTNQAGLISDFVDAGAHAVIADLWANNGEGADVFIADFYRRLEASGNIATALYGAKRQYLQNNRNTGLYDWAGFQIFIK